MQTSITIPNFAKSKKPIYQTSIVTTDKKMANNIVVEPHSFLLDVTVDEINGDILIKTKKEYNGYKVYDQTFKITFDLVPLQQTIHQKVGYPESFDRVILTSSVKTMYRYNQKHLINMDPEYQRELVWSLKQKESYIKNLFHECAKISLTIAEYYDEDNNEIMEIIDGKQRLSTIFDFIDNKFALDGLYYKDLQESDRNYIWWHSLSYERILTKSYKRPKLETLIQLFLEINQLGTKMSNEDLEKAQSLLK